jgi:hypothetical protein
MLTLDNNHGIPTGVNTRQKLVLVFLKQNLMIVVNYDSGQDDDVDYVSIVNENISYLVDILKKSLVIDGS